MTKWTRLGVRDYHNHHRAYGRGRKAAPGVAGNAVQERARIRVWRNYPTCSNRKAAEVQGATTQPVQALADPAYIRKFGFCRICFRKLRSPGRSLVSKSSW